MTAHVIDLNAHRRTRRSAEAPVEAIRSFLNQAVFVGNEPDQATLVVPLPALERLMAVTLPEQDEQP